MRSLLPSKNASAKVVAITGGESHSLFLFDNGKVLACGRCDGHEVGLASDHPAILQAVRKDSESSNMRGATKEDVSDQKEEAPVTYTPFPVEISFPVEADGSPTIISSFIARNRQ